jgi:hypothetical protein
MYKNLKILILKFGKLQSHIISNEIDKHVISKFGKLQSHIISNVIDKHVISKFGKLQSPNEFNKHVISKFGKPHVIYDQLTILYNKKNM